MHNNPRNFCHLVALAVLDLQSAHLGTKATIPGHVTHTDAAINEAGGNLLHHGYGLTNIFGHYCMH